MSDLDHTAALGLGGWDPRYAVVLAAASRDGVAAALVDTNGDGADIDLDQYEQRLDGRWVEVSSGNCDDTGSFWTGFMGVAWGRADPMTTIRVDYQGARYAVQSSDRGWWMFVAPSHSNDVPHVAVPGEHAL